VKRSRTFWTQEQDVDDQRERDGESAPEERERHQLTLRALVLVAERHEVVVRHRVQVDARHVLEDRRADAVARQVERGAVEYGPVMHRVG